MEEIYLVGKWGWILKVKNGDYVGGIKPIKKFVNFDSNSRFHLHEGDDIESRIQLQGIWNYDKENSTLILESNGKSDMNFKSEFSMKPIIFNDIVQSIILNVKKDSILTEEEIDKIEAIELYHIE